jgi:hypothetical protein
VDITYINSFANPYSKVRVAEREYVVPKIGIACIREDATADNVSVRSIENGVRQVQKNLMAIFGDPDLDDAVRLVVTYEGESFHDSIKMREGIVGGCYGFQAIFGDKTCKVAYMFDEKKIVFVPPQDIVDELRAA